MEATVRSSILCCTVLALRTGSCMDNRSRTLILGNTTLRSDSVPQLGPVWGLPATVPPLTWHFGRHMAFKNCGARRFSRGGHEGRLALPLIPSTDALDEVMSLERNECCGRDRRLFLAVTVSGGVEMGGNLVSHLIRVDL